MNITDATKVTKGDILTNTINGRRYTVLTTTPSENGTVDSHGNGNLITMVRPIHVGRAFDIIYSQHSLDAGLYTVTRPAK